MELEGTVVGSTIDQYAPSPSTYLTVPVATVTFGTTGTHTIRLTTTGKEAASTSYEISADAFTLILQSGTQVTAPAFDLVPGTYTNVQSVTITSATSGAAIRAYTTGFQRKHTHAKSWHHLQRTSKHQHTDDAPGPRLRGAACSTARSPLPIMLSILPARPRLGPVCRSLWMRRKPVPFKSPYWICNAICRKFWESLRPS